MMTIVINFSRNRGDVKTENMKTKKENWGQVTEELQQ
jgi:hypothetical protein